MSITVRKANFIKQVKVDVRPISITNYRTATNISYWLITTLLRNQWAKGYLRAANYHKA